MAVSILSSVEENWNDATPNYLLFILKVITTSGLICCKVTIIFLYNAFRLSIFYYICRHERIIYFDSHIQ